MTSQFGLVPAPEEAAGVRTVVRFTGGNASLDHVTLLRIRKQLFDLADEPEVGHVIFDLGNVNFVSSIALSTFVSLHHRLRASGRHMTIRNLRPRVHEVFTVTRLNRFLDLRPAPDVVEDEEECPAGLPSGVLIADDEASVLRVLALGLRQEGFDVWSACHGLQAIDLYRRHRGRIAVVLLDVLMPGMDGPCVLGILQRIRPSVRCCFMTGDPTPYTEEALLRLGAARVFYKPFALTEVIDTVAELASTSPRQREERWIDLSGERRANDARLDS
jgi:anti-anti-sigma factor